jgi:hypothetical protein
MTDQPRYQGADEDTGAGRRPSPARQRWACMAVIVIVAVLLLLMVILHITGTFGPGSHG